jgi:hypothetical protein
MNWLDDDEVDSTKIFRQEATGLLDVKDLEGVSNY